MSVVVLFFSDQPRREPVAVPRDRVTETQSLATHAADDAVLAISRPTLMLSSSPTNAVPPDQILECRRRVVGRLRADARVVLLASMLVERVGLPLRRIGVVRVVEQQLHADQDLGNGEGWVPSIGSAGAWEVLDHR